MKLTLHSTGNSFSEFSFTPAAALGATVTAVPTTPSSESDHTSTFTANGSLEHVF